MNDVPSPTDLVLVCLIPQPRDLEIARVLGWYRIPLRHAPKVVFVDCLAFYQPASFGKEHQWMIEYVAPVRGVELTRRRDLLKEEIDHPRAGDEYYKIGLGDLVKLSKPIPADVWKRITFFYTSGEQILCANSISDLLIGQARKDLFQNIGMERRSRFADIPTGDMAKLQQEFLQYILEVNDAVKKNDHAVQEIDFE